MKKLITLFIIGLILGSCAGTKRSGSTEESPMTDMPEWALVRPEAEDALYGVASAKKQNPALATRTATARARAEVADAVTSKVSAMMKDFMQESGLGDNAQAIEFSESVIKQVSSVSLKGCKVKEVYPAKDGTIYVLVEYPLNGVRDSALQEARKREALYNEFKAQKGFEELEEAIKNLE